jgi:A/G-specific adenine glycosylase
VTESGEILLRRRVETGLLGGMTEVPTTPWTARIDGGTTVDHAPFEARWEPSGVITHVFTHFELRLSVYRTRVGSAQAHAGWWVPVDDLNEQALPTVMKKVISQAIPTAFT